MFLLRSMVVLCFITIFQCVSYSNEYPSQFSVAAVQFQPRGSVDKNTEIIIGFLKRCSEQNIRIAVFQECAVTGYDKKVIQRSDEQELLHAERKIATACDQMNLYAVVGVPHYSNGNLYNTAVVFNPEGETVARYAKIQLVGGDSWAKSGDQLMVFKIDGFPCSIIICHDERYPELVRLPVLAGARLVFYVSSESSVTAESKLKPYRAQIAARADENDIYIVQANAPAMESHGQSRIIAPDGNLLAEAGMFEETMITATLDLSKANGATAKNSLRFKGLRSWWENGIEMVKILN